MGKTRSDTLTNHLRHIKNEAHPLLLQILQLPHDRAIVVSQLDAQTDDFAVPLGAFRLKPGHTAGSFRFSYSAVGNSPFGSSFSFNFAFVRRSEFHGPPQFLLIC